MTKEEVYNIIKNRYPDADEIIVLDEGTVWLGRPKWIDYVREYEIERPGAPLATFDKVTGKEEKIDLFQALKLKK